MSMRMDELTAAFPRLTWTVGSDGSFMGANDDTQVIVRQSWTWSATTKGRTVVGESAVEAVTRLRDNLEELATELMDASEALSDGQGWKECDVCTGMGRPSGKSPGGCRPGCSVCRYTGRVKA